MPVSRSRYRRRGLTLIELMASIAVSLLMILGMVKFFEVIGDNVALGRAQMELAGKLRAVTNRLQDDFNGITVPGRPWPKQSAGLGYLEIGEGLIEDTDYFATNTIYGDQDDYVAFTARSSTTPFVGRVRSEIVGQPAGSYVTIQSNLAEIIWWLHLDDRNGNGTFDINEGETFTLRRRIFLIRPDLANAAGLVPNVSVTNNAQLLLFHNDNDLSVRFDPVNSLLATNTLATLTRRENRVAHIPGVANYPNFLDPVALPQQTGVFQGEDIMLSHVLAFDLKVFDPTAQVRYDANNDQALIPGDPGFNTGLTLIGNGAYVDLGYAFRLGLGGVSSFYSGRPSQRSGFFAANVYPYDTWSFDYEHDLLNQDSATDGMNPVIDEGTDGIDNDNNGRVDEAEERETAPPYPLPLRGFQAHIRVIDRSTRLVRQATVRRDMTPE